MRLLDLPRTSGFRLALVFLALFGLASTVLFGFLYTHTQDFLVARVDDWLKREAPVIVNVEPDLAEQQIAGKAARNASTDSIFMLLDRDGNRLAGFSDATQVVIPAFDRPSDLTLRPKGGAGVRGIAHRLPDGRIVMLGQSMEELEEFKEDFIRTTLWGIALTTALGLVGALIVAVSTVRRFDGMADTIESIVQGDLSRRLPVDGGLDDIDRLASVVNAMLDDIERLMNEVKGVCDGIAHDLRTPLTRLLAGLERARRNVEHGASQDHALDEAIERVGTILQTFSSLLRISEVEDGARRAGFVPVALPDVSADVIDFYEPVAEGKQVTLRLTCPEPGSAVLQGDPSLLFEAVGNLVENGIKYAPAGGHVTVEISRQAGHLVLGVRDNGPGIDASERETVLRRFYRAGKSRSVEGSGLGLSLVAAVARLHHLTVVIADTGPGCHVMLTTKPAV